jgi:DNA-binding MarR family transcriptional regulator
MEAAPREEPVVLDDGVFRLEDWLPYEFSFVANRVKGALAQVYVERYGFTVAGWRVVAVLGSHPNMSAKDLAEMVGMDQVNITRAVAKLAKLGMVVRRTNQADRRSISLRLSAKGMAAYNDIMPVAWRIQEILLRTLTPTQRATLGRLMAAVVAQAKSSLVEGQEPSGADAAA